MKHKKAKNQPYSMPKSNLYQGYTSVYVLMLSVTLKVGDTSGTSPDIQYSAAV